MQTDGLIPYLSIMKITPNLEVEFKFNEYTEARENQKS